MGFLEGLKNTSENNNYLKAKDRFKIFLGAPNDGTHESTIEKLSDNMRLNMYEYEVCQGRIILGFFCLPFWGFLAF